MFELALEKYPWEKNRSIALPYFVRHAIFSKKFYEKGKFDKVMDELYSREVQDLLSNKKKMEYFSKFFDDNCKRDKFDDKVKDVIDLKLATKLSIDFGVIPDLISKVFFVKLFKLVQK